MSTVFWLVQGSGRNFGSDRLSDGDGYGSGYDLNGYGDGWGDGVGGNGAGDGSGYDLNGGGGSNSSGALMPALAVPRTLEAHAVVAAVLGRLP